MAFSTAFPAEARAHGLLQARRRGYCPGRRPQPAAQFAALRRFVRARAAALKMARDLEVRLDEQLIVDIGIQLAAFLVTVVFLDLHFRWAQDNR
jgi:hypothetical protein